MSPVNANAVERTRVAIIGAGPAGLVLSHRLAEAGIDSIVVERRSREEIEETIRAGILEHGTVDVLREISGSRVDTVGQRHDGVELRVGGEGHRVDLRGLTGRSVWLYPQHEVLRDLIAARLDAGQDVRFGAEVVDIEEPLGERPRVLVGNADGARSVVEADFVVGADGSRGVTRSIVAGRSQDGYFREYPFAWFGILCEAAPSSEELIYSSSDDGFALVSRRSESVQRMYFQCDPGVDPASFSEEQLWDELQRRVPGTELVRGPIFQRDVLRFRSYVAQTLLRGRVALVGDAAHTVPPTGAKGLNLAVADVLVLERALRDLLLAGDDRALLDYPAVASKRIWKAQHFSWWMTSMLHVAPGSSAFDRRRQVAELEMVVSSEAGRRFLAEGYTGW